MKFLPKKGNERKYQTCDCQQKKSLKDVNHLL